MKKTAAYSIVLILLLFYTSIYGQQKIIDSLEKIVNNTKLLDKDKIIPLTQLAQVYTPRDMSKSMKFAKEAASLAKDQKEAKYGALAYSRLAFTYSQIGDIPNAYSMIEKSNWYIENTSDIDIKIKCYISIGILKLGLEDKEGLEEIFKSLKLSKETNNFAEQVRIYSILTNYYMLDYNKFDEYSQLAIEAAVKVKNKALLSMAWMGRGVGNLAEFEKNKNQRELNQAISCLRKAMQLYEEEKINHKKEDNYRTILNNLLQAYQLKNDLKYSQANLDSIAYYSKRIVKVEGNTINEKITEYFHLSTIERGKKNYVEAEQLLLKAVNLISDNKNTRQGYEVYTQLSLLYERMGDSDKALESNRKAMGFFQKYYDEKYEKIGQEQYAKYELSKKEQEIQFRKRLNLLYIGIASILFLSLVFLFFTFKFRVKYLKQKKEEALLLAKLKEEEKLNAELDAKLKEKRANKLEKEVISKTAQVSYKNEMLENLKQNIKDNPEFTLENLNRIIKNETILDRNFDDFEKTVKETDPKFYNRLQKAAQQKLTTLDLKYCIYIYMKIPSKEMADLLHVEIKTVRMNKYRLKQKLGLSKEENLEDFIQNMV